MAGTPVYMSGGTDTVEVNVAVTRGQGVEQDSTTGKVKPWTAGTKVAAGVAQESGAPAGSNATDNFAPLPSKITVTRAPYVQRMVYAATASYRAFLKAAANGQVTPWVDGTDSPAMIIGRCDEQAGAASAGGTYKVLLLNI